MIIYRVENKQGYGPWTSGTVDDYRCVLPATAQDPGDHPGPTNPLQCGTDLPTKWEEWYGRYPWPDPKFGCCSIEQLLRWFPEEIGRKAMAAKGDVIAIYEVPDHETAEGVLQVIYLPTNAQRSGQVDLVALQ